MHVLTFIFTFCDSGLANPWETSRQAWVVPSKVKVSPPGFQYPSIDSSLFIHFLVQVWFLVQVPGVPVSLGYQCPWSNSLVYQCPWSISLWSVPVSLVWSMYQYHVPVSLVWSMYQCPWCGPCTSGWFRLRTQKLPRLLWWAAKQAKERKAMLPQETKRKVEKNKKRIFFILSSHATILRVRQISLTSQLAGQFRWLRIFSQIFSLY